MKNLRQIVLEEIKRVINEDATQAQFSVANSKLMIANRPTKISISSPVGRFDDITVLNAIKNADGSADITVRSGPFTKTAHFLPQKVQAIITSISAGKPFNDESALGTLTITPV